MEENKCTIFWGKEDGRIYDSDGNQFNDKKDWEEFERDQE